MKQEKCDEKDKTVGATNPIASLRYSTRKECPGKRPRKDIVKFQQQSGELQGQIRVFEPGSGLLIVERNSVTYSFTVTPGTKILVGNQKAKIEDLVGLKGKSVTVKYRAERKGNKANEIVVP